MNHRVTMMLIGNMPVETMGTSGVYSLLRVLQGPVGNSGDHRYSGDQRGDHW